MVLKKIACTNIYIYIFIYLSLKLKLKCVAYLLFACSSCIFVSSLYCHKILVLFCFAIVDVYTVYSLNIVIYILSLFCFNSYIDFCVGSNFGQHFELNNLQPHKHTHTHTSTKQPTMTIHNFHIFDSSGNCLFALHDSDKTEQQKILYGFMYSLKSFMNRMTPNLHRDNNFFLYSTSHYHLFFHEFPTSIKFVFILSADMRNDSDFYRELSTQIYREIYVQYVVKNPTISYQQQQSTTASETVPNTPLSHMAECELFRNYLNIFFEQYNIV